MISAYVLVEASPGKAKELADKMKGITGVKSVHVVTGPYDIIIHAEAQDLHQLGELVIARLHTLGGVMKTTTPVVAD